MKFLFLSITLSLSLSANAGSSLYGRIIIDQQESANSSEYTYKSHSISRGPSSVRASEVGMTIKPNEKYYYLDNLDGCYVKEYVDKKFFIVSSNILDGKTLIGRALKEDKDMFGFMLDKKTYVTPSVCVTSI